MVLWQFHLLSHPPPSTSSLLFSTSHRHLIDESWTHHSQLQIVRLSTGRVKQCMEILLSGLCENSRELIYIHGGPEADAISIHHPKKFVVISLSRPFTIHCIQWFLFRLFLWVTPSRTDLMKQMHLDALLQ